MEDRTEQVRQKHTGANTPETNLESKPYFEEVADKWDEMRQRFFPDSVRDTALKVAKLQAGKKAADIGAGTGFITQGLVEKGLSVIAVDQSPAMLETLKANLSAHAGLVDCRVGVAENLPISDGSLDYVFANMYLHHVDSPPKAIAEMARVLRPGGSLIITDLDEHNYEFLRTEQYDRWLGFKREELKDWFVSAGLKNVEVGCVGSNCCSNSECGCEQAQISIFVAKGDK